jgi:hypothetical protein
MPVGQPASISLGTAPGATSGAGLYVTLPYMRIVMYSQSGSLTRVAYHSPKERTANGAHSLVSDF